MAAPRVTIYSRTLLSALPVRTTRARDTAYQRLQDMIVGLRLPPGLTVDEQ